MSHFVQAVVVVVDHQTEAVHFLAVMVAVGRLSHLL
jgi:hypothetical protein